MNRIALALAAAVFATAAAHAEDFDRTLNVSANPSLNVLTGSGWIHLRPGSDNQIHVVGHVHGGGSSFFGGSGDVDSRIRQIAANPPIQQSGNSITVGNHQSHDDLFRNISIDYEITVPRNVALSAMSGSGDIEIQEVGTSLKAQTGSGSIRARGIRGGGADLQTGSGDIELQENGQGDVRAMTGSGAVRLQGVNGGLRVQTGSGDIEVQNAILTSDWRCDTGSGSVRLGLSPNSHFTLDASTGSGTVRSQQPLAMQGELNKHHITGTVNGGGPALRIRTGSGDIEIH